MPSLTAPFQLFQRILDLKIRYDEPESSIVMRAKMGGNWSVRVFIHWSSQYSCSCSCCCCCYLFCLIFPSSSNRSSAHPYPCVGRLSSKISAQCEVRSFRLEALVCILLFVHFLLLKIVSVYFQLKLVRSCTCMHICIDLLKSMMEHFLSGSAMFHFSFFFFFDFCFHWISFFTFLPFHVFDSGACRLDAGGSDQRRRLRGAISAHVQHYSPRATVTGLQTVLHWLLRPPQGLFGKFSPLRSRRKKTGEIEDWKEKGKSKKKKYMKNEKKEENERFTKSVWKKVETNRKESDIRTKIEKEAKSNSKTTKQKEDNKKGKEKNNARES